MEKKIKIIDLLNKIANGEEVPKSIKYNNYIYVVDEEDNDYRRGTFDKGDFTLLYDLEYIYKLNHEVEILDEEDEIKTIKTLNLEQDELVNNKDIRPIDYLFEGTINELIINQKKIIMRLKDE